jgi:hypothetical protein
MNIEELKRQCYVLGNAIGELGAELYELNGKIADLVINNNLDKKYTELYQKKEELEKTLEEVINEFKRLEDIIKSKS